MGEIRNVPDTNVGDKAQLSDKGTTFENGGEIKRWSKDIISRQAAMVIAVLYMEGREE